jgi:hypothetical protein
MRLCDTPITVIEPVTSKKAKAGLLKKLRLAKSDILSPLILKVLHRG